MISKFGSVLASFKAKLSRKIVLWTFASIVVIEVIILVPSYYRREQELKQQLEKVSEVIVKSVARLKQKGIPEDFIWKEIESAMKNPIIKGIQIYRSNGTLAGEMGEKPDIPFAQIKNNAIRRRSNYNGDRYDIAWGKDKIMAEYVVIIRHDSTQISQELIDYIIRITILVIIISAFVTLTMMIVLGFIIIEPTLQLRDNLIAAGESLSKNNINKTQLSCLSSPRNDELGEVMIAFQEMYNRIYKEQEKSQRLLLNILPEVIAIKLKEGQNHIAQAFDEVSILFADLVGFTQLSSNISARELITLLNDIFSRFDGLTEKYNLEKIKTIGDAYMVVGGLPIPDSNHVHNIADMALEMLKTIEEFNSEYDQSLSIRIGINLGSAIAGVIGTKKFIYDIWGDSVNTASRMESHGIPNKIHVTEILYQKLKTNYKFETRGEIDIKGKGKMRTYFLTDKIPDMIRSEPILSPECNSHPSSLTDLTIDKTLIL